MIMAFAVLWNFETGIVCCLAWAAFRGIDVLQNEKDLIKCIKGVTERIISVIMIPILASFGVVNLYNLFCGGIGALLGIKEFMGMAIDESYIKFLCTPIEWGNMIYLHRVMVFMFVLCWGMLYNPLFGIKGLEKKAGYAVVNGIIGLGLMTYYMNRTLAGDNLVNLFFVICLGLILDGITRISKIRDARTAHIYNVIKYMTGVYAFLVLFGCGLQAIEVYQGYVDKYNGRAYSYDEFEEFAQEVSQTVPQNTWAMGEGTSALYMELGWEKGTWGFGDIQADEMPEQDGLFVCNARYEHVPDSFELVHEFEYYDIIFGYFTKKAE